MTCVSIGNGILCVGGRLHEVRSHGERFWIEWHDYMGVVALYRDAHGRSEIKKPSRAQWSAVNEWARAR